LATDFLQPRNSVNGINRQRETINFIVHRQLHRRIDVALFFVSTNVQLLVFASIRQPMNQIGIAVEVEDDRFVGSKQRVIVRIRQSVRMVLTGLKLEEIHDIDESDLNIWKLLAQQEGRGKGLLRRYVAGGCHYEVRLDSLVVADPIPN